MSLSRRKLLHATMAAAVAGPFVTKLSHAQTARKFPDRPVRWIVPFSPGGITDVLARVFAAELQGLWGQSVVVENKPGGNTLIGTNLAAKSPPDGYTLFTITPPLVLGKALQPTSAFPEDPLELFKPVYLIAKIPNAIVVPSESPFKSPQDLIAAAKLEPKKILYGVSSIGAATHLAGELFCSRMGIEMEAMAYKGSGPIVTAILGNQVPLTSDTLPLYLPHIASGNARALVVLGPERAASLPDTPSMSDLGHPDFEAAGWQGVAVPAETPSDIVEQISRDILAVTKMPEVRKKFAAQGIDLPNSSPSHFGKWMATETHRYTELIRNLGLKMGA